MGQDAPHPREHEQGRQVPFRRFGTIFVLDVPKMGLNQKDLVSVACALRPSAVLTDGVVGAALHHLRRRVLREQGQAPRHVRGAHL